MTIPIAALPSDQRPRERLLAVGPHALSDGELLALLLRQGRCGVNALELASELLTEFGGPAGLASARPEELATRSGMGLAKAASVSAAFQLAARARRPSGRGPRLTSAEEVFRVAEPLFAGVRVERLLVLVADTRNRLRRAVFVAEGAVDQVAVPIREILNTALRHDGRSFAVVHNHPSGDPVPSVDDRRATTLLVAAAATVGIRFLHHVVIADQQWSLAPP